MNDVTMENKKRPMGLQDAWAAVVELEAGFKLAYSVPVLAQLLS